MSCSPDLVVQRRPVRPTDRKESRGPDVPQLIQRIANELSGDCADHQSGGACLRQRAASAHHDRATRRITSSDSQRVMRFVYADIRPGTVTARRNRHVGALVVQRAFFRRVLDDEALRVMRGTRRD
jgi:hypothetical protein